MSLKVKDLIEELQKLDPEMPVHVNSCEVSDSGPADAFSGIAEVVRAKYMEDTTIKWTWWEYDWHPNIQFENTENTTEVLLFYQP